jgi:hypothetical protein
MSVASTWGPVSVGVMASGAQQAPHDPGLAPDLGGKPAREHSDKAGWPSEKGAP